MTNNWIKIPPLPTLSEKQNEERERYINCFINNKDCCSGNWGNKMNAQALIRNLQIKSICDVGCGVGNWAYMCATELNISRIVAIDPASITLSNLLKDTQGPSNGMIQNGTLRIHPNITYLEGDACHIPIPDKSVDCTTSFEVFEHILPQDIDEALLEVIRVTREYVILLICKNPSTEFNGLNNHPSLKSSEEWTSLLNKYFSSVCTLDYNRDGKSVSFLCTI